VEELKVENVALREKIDKFGFLLQARGVSGCSGMSSYPHLADAPVAS